MFPFLQIKRYKDFEKNILPKIDAIAEEKGKTVSDLVRDILYARLIANQQSQGHLRRLMKTT
jgi:hypothetical protein